MGGVLERETLRLSVRGQAMGNKEGLLSCCRAFLAGRPSHRHCCTGSSLLALSALPIIIVVNGCTQCSLFLSFTNLCSFLSACMHSSILLFAAR